MAVSNDNNNRSKKSSRICVKNLPQRLTLDDLKQFFSQKGELTDAKLILNKDGKSRVAYIGYRTEQEAEEAIKYFNRSYLKSSSITCEFSLSYGDPNIPRPWGQRSKEGKKLAGRKRSFAGSGANIGKNTPLKCNESDDPKFREFYHVVQSRSKSKFWADDVMQPTFNQDCQVNETVRKKQKKSHFNQDCQVNETVRKKPKKSISELSFNKTVPEENWMDDGRSAQLQNTARDYILTDQEYFESKIRMDWSDSEIDIDENGIDFSQDHGGLCYEETNSGNLCCSSKHGNKVLQSSRLYVHNIDYATTEDELAGFFSEFGDVKKVHLVTDKETKRSKGFGYVFYSTPEEAARALEKLDHPIFQGRVLHVVPAETRHDLEKSVSEGKGKTYKQQRVERRKTLESSGHTQAWNSLHMRPDTVVEYIARKYGVSKSNLLSCEADDLAVRFALWETQIIADTLKALTNAGVNVASLEAFIFGKSEGGKRSNHILLVKNLPFSSSKVDLLKMFGRFGSIEKIILPPTKTLALVIFLEPAEARVAFDCLRYKRYRDALLYLEWAPSTILSQDPTPNGDSKSTMVVGSQEVTKGSLEQIMQISEAEMDPEIAESRTVYVKNLNFKTTDESFGKHIRENMKEGKLLSSRIVKHLEMGKYFSSGYAFVEFDSMETANYICKALQGTVLDGHALSLQLHHPKEDKRVLKKAEDDRSSTKLKVGNVAFEATKKDLRQLFSPFGQVKSLRLPKGLEKHRGFAFVEYVTKQEAHNALKALSSTHLYGRRLVLERAKEGETLEEKRARTAAQLAGEGRRIQKNPMKVTRKRKIRSLV